MEAEVRTVNRTYIDGMELSEFHGMLSQSTPEQVSAYEQYVAQKSPHGFILGLQIATMYSRVRGLRSTEFNYDAWVNKLDKLYKEQVKLGSEDEGWGMCAFNVGCKAAKQTPLTKYHVSGL